ncbi:MAG: hypothetical protein PW789_16335 [Edaphobacter sp.]|uniref:hypothetical protein n=1 Tax=Edaphobacter sp. TaxID=1934404 RepID=UPI00239D9B2E|nr:hypothetical protein [Edaphobacter sp.]MDE1178142.1 hypothetical protein [Edaphobacter sp.]
MMKKIALLMRACLRAAEHWWFDILQRSRSRHLGLTRHSLSFLRAPGSGRLAERADARSWSMRRKAAEEEGREGFAPSAFFPSIPGKGRLDRR